MSDEVLNPQIRLSGIDDTESVFASAEQRVQKFAEGVKKNLGAVAHENAKGHSEVAASAKHVADAAKESSKRVEEFAYSISRALGRSTDFFTTAAASIEIFGGRIGQAFEAGAIEEVVRRSTEAFAKVEEAMIRVQNATGATSTQIMGLQAEFEDLARETGRGVPELAEHFQLLATRSGLELGKVKELFPLIAREAFAAGADIDATGVLVANAIKTMKVPMEDVPKLLDAWVTLLPGIQDDFTRFFSRFSLDLNYFGLTGKQNAIAVAAEFRYMSEAFGGGTQGARRATSEMGQLWGKMTQGFMGMNQYIAEAEASGKGFGEVMAEVDKRLTEGGWFNTENRQALLMSVGQDMAAFLILQHEGQKKITEDIIAGMNATGAVETRNKRLQDDSEQAFRDMGAGFEELKVGFGALMGVMAVPTAMKAFGELMKDIAETVGGLAGSMHLLAESIKGTPEYLARVAKAKAEAEAAAAASGVPPVLGPAFDVVHPASRLGLPTAPGLRPPSPQGKPSRIEIPLPMAPGGLPKLPKFQHGGIVNDPTVALIGEHGPEAVVPLSHGGGSNPMERAIRDNTDAVKELTELVRWGKDSGSGVGGGVGRGGLGGGVGSGGVGSIGGSSGGIPTGSRGGISGAGGGSGSGSGSSVVDQSGKGVDPDTVSSLKQMAARGDTRGMQGLMAQRGYRVDSAWCGDLARTLVGGSGFQVPKGYPVASTWRTAGEHMDPSGINAPGGEFGSMIASKTNVPIGQTGGHVMTIVPGTWNPKDNTAEVIDTGGRRRRSLNGFEERHLQAAGIPAGAANVGGGVRASTFNDTRTASGRSAASTEGIAIPSGGHMGDMYSVTTPDGRTVNVPLIDRGPAGWTGRGLDVSEPLANRLGMGGKKFPTDQGLWHIQKMRQEMEKPIKPRFDIAVARDQTAAARRQVARQQARWTANTVAQDHRWGSMSDIGFA